MDPKTVGHICDLFNRSVSCQYLFSTDTTLDETHGLKATVRVETDIEYRGGGEHIAFVWEKLEYNDTSTDKHDYDWQLRNISSCSVDTNENISNQISSMQEMIDSCSDPNPNTVDSEQDNIKKISNLDTMITFKNDVSTYPSLQSNSITSNKTDDSQSTPQSQLPNYHIPFKAPQSGKGQTTTTGQQIEGSPVVTLSSPESNAERNSVSESNNTPNEKKMTQAESNRSQKRNHETCLLSDMNTTTGQQFLGSEVVTLFPNKSNGNYCSVSEENLSLDEEKMSDLSPNNQPHNVKESNSMGNSVAETDNNIYPNNSSGSERNLLRLSDDDQGNELDISNDVECESVSKEVLGLRLKADESSTEDSFVHSKDQNDSPNEERTSEDGSSQSHKSGTYIPILPTQSEGNGENMNDNNINPNNSSGSERNSSRSSDDDQGNESGISNVVDYYGTGVEPTTSEKLILNGNHNPNRKECESESVSKEEIVLLESQSRHGKRRVSEAVPACKKLKMSSPETLRAFEALDKYFASESVVHKEVSEYWNIMRKSIYRKWFIVYSLI